MANTKYAQRISFVVNVMEDRVLDIIDSKKEELASFLQRLIQFDSVNPPGGEGPIAKYIAERLRASGFEVELVEVAEGRPNVVGRIKGSGGKPSLLVYGHSDVVPVGDLENWTYPPFEGKMLDGEIHGRGAQDHKFPIPPLVIALDAIKEAGLRLKGDLVITVVADEETGGEYGFRWLVENGYFDDTDSMIYGGAGRDGSVVVVGANGQLATTVIVRGKGAHTGNLEKGVNAIVKANKVIARLQELADVVNSRTHPLTGRARMSINMIQAGEKINVLPDKCVITVDRRITPAENFEDAREEIQRALDELRKDDSGLDVELITQSGMHPVASDPDSELVRVLKKAGEDLRGGETVRVTGSQGSSDYSWYVNILGKPAASYSMSSTERRGHAPNEYVKVDDLVKTAKAYALTYMRYLGVESR
jgi:succinyl-diaminopimelate desuccinylase